MKFLLALIATLACYANAMPKPMPQPQGFDFDAISDLPPPPTYTMSLGATAQVVKINTASMISSAVQAVTTDPIVDPARKVKRQAATSVAPTASSCVGGNAQPTGSGPLTTPDTPDAFVANSAYSSAANGAATPAGYQLMFQNLQGSTSLYYYMGYNTLTSYDTGKCASLCNAISLCQSFNIYFERDPTVDPGSGTGCSNPPSTTVIKCVFWGGPITAETATNTGQYRDDFEVVIAGSNGYTSSNVVQPPGYSGTMIGNAAINAPLDCNGADTYLGVRLTNGGPFDPSLCASICTAQSNYDVAHPPSDGSPPQLCNFFNTYVLLKNGVPLGQYCSLYNQTWDQSYATNTGQYDDQGNVYTIMDSYIASNTTNPGVCA